MAKKTPPGRVKKRPASGKHPAAAAFTWRNISGHFSFQDVYDLAVADAPKDAAVFVEIGTYLGQSTAYLAHKIRESGKNIVLHAVDNFTGEGSTPGLRAKFNAPPDFYEMFLDNLRRCGVAEMVHPLRSDSTQAAGQFADESMDFAYIDASHHYRKVKLDILAWLPKVKPGGLIGGHDYNAHHAGVVRAVHEVFTDTPVEIMRHSWLVRKSP